MEAQIANYQLLQESSFKSIQQQAPQDVAQVSSRNFGTSEQGQQITIDHKSSDSVRCKMIYKKNVFSKLYNQKLGRGECKEKLLSYKIKEQFKKYVVKTPRIIECIKSISNQIKKSILRQDSSPQNNNSQTAQQIIQPTITHQSKFNLQNYSFRTVEDQTVIRQNQLRNLLVPTIGDNDVSSDDQDLRKGMTYLYRQLVHSVGENYQQSKAKREQKDKKQKNKDSNKENDFNTANIQLNRNQEKKAHTKHRNNSKCYSNNPNRANLVNN